MRNTIIKKSKKKKKFIGQILNTPVIGECVYLFNKAANVMFRTSEITATMTLGSCVFIETLNTKYWVSG